MKNKKQKFYVQFRDGSITLHKIEAFTEEEARKIAIEKFGDSENGVKWVIGTLRSSNEKPKAWENQLLKYI